ncbi:hypothetical protein ABLN79_04260, partial [Mycobacterium tuberculosis]
RTSFQLSLVFNLSEDLLRPSFFAFIVKRFRVFRAPLRVESDIKKHARLNMMAHLLSTIDYADVEKPKVKLPPRPLVSGNYRRPPRELSTYVDDYVATLIAR